jgi:hypothetical protein
MAMFSYSNPQELFAVSPRVWKNGQSIFKEGALARLVSETPACFHPHFDGYVRILFIGTRGGLDPKYRPKKKKNSCKACKGTGNKKKKKPQPCECGCGTIERKPVVLRDQWRREGITCKKCDGWGEPDKALSSEWRTRFNREIRAACLHWVEFSSNKTKTKSQLIAIYKTIDASKLPEDDDAFA